MKTDLFVFSIMEGSLLILFMLAIIIDIRNRINVKSASYSAEVIRGEQSMNALHIYFGITTVVFSLIVQTFHGLKGNQILFIFLNYFFLTYLFLFSSWFRNKVFFKFIIHTKKD